MGGGNKPRENEMNKESTWGAGGKGSFFF